MSVIFGLIPGMILLGLVGVLIFFWAVKSGQYEDMEGPAHRILNDDDMEDDKGEGRRHPGYGVAGGHPRRPPAVQHGPRPRSPCSSLRPQG